jgi:hypothetical protein
MNLQRWLQLHLVALSALGATFVALSTGNFAMPIAVGVAGMVALVFTDALSYVRVHRAVANIVAVFAVGYSLYHFFGGGLHLQLRAIANLLAYLQFILFFQDKNDRVYWHLILLSLLQVVVGAALDLGMMFGVLLAAYTFVSLTALVLFFLHREAHANHDRLQVFAPTVVPRGAPPSIALDAVLMNTLSRLGMRNAMFIALGALLFAMVYFHASPRHPDFSYALFRGQSSAQTGFSRELELQQMGEMLQNSEAVMRVWLLNDRRQPMRRFEPYFAGEVLPFYEEGKARWKISQVRRDEIEEIDQEGALLEPAPPKAFFQQIHLRGSNQRALFTIAPAYAAANTATNDLRIDRASGLPFRKPPKDAFHFPDMKFTLATTGLVANYQPQLTPISPPRGRAERVRSVLRLEEATEFPVASFTGLSRVAEEWLELKLVDTGNPHAVAKSLEDHFHTPGLYTYSLNMNLPRDPALDPIEDFVMNHRTGHCQYFASALALMLRSRGIPARIVVGYRGYEYNESFHYYQVQQRHAHAWVEAYLAPEAIPENETLAGPNYGAGAWLRLDPTPSGEEHAAALARSWLGAARDWLDYFDFVWSDYVVGLNQIKQQSSWIGAGQNAQTEETAALWWSRWKQIAAWLGIHVGEGNRGISFDSRAAVSAMALAAMLLILFGWIRKRWQQWRKQALWRWQRRERGRPQIPFYVRLEKLLAREIHERPPGQTPREYTEHCALLVDDHQRLAIRTVVDAFYRVRYGGDALAAERASELQGLLDQLERDYAGRGNQE